GEYRGAASGSDPDVQRQLVASHVQSLRRGAASSGWSALVRTRPPMDSSLSPDILVHALLDARRVERELFEGLADGQLLGQPGHFLEPPIWEIGHVGWFQEYWILRHLDGDATLLPGSDAIYESFNVPYRLRWQHPFPSRQATLDYIERVLRRVDARLDSRRPDVQEAYFYPLAALNEDMHAENLTLVLQTLGYACPRVSLTGPPASDPPIDPAYAPHDVDVPGGRFCLGATSEEPFVFDNEKWAHEIEVSSFRIRSVPVTNTEFAAFVDDGGDWRPPAGGPRGRGRR